MTEVGFGVVDASRDGCGLDMHLVKLRQRRTSMLLPPGMGDCFWVIAKLQSFLEKNKLGIPDVYVVSDSDHHNHRHLRAFEFIEMFPFLCSTGICITNGVDLARREICREAYHDSKRPLFRDVMGCDYFLGFNGLLHAGVPLEQVLPEYECNWLPPMFVSLEQERYRNECLEKYGRYAIFYFSSVGDYGFWMEEFPPPAIVHSVEAVSRRAGVTPIFTGGSWDRDCDKVLGQVIKNIPSAIDLRGKTTLQQLFGLIRSSELVLTFPTGLAIIAACLGKKVLAIWNRYYQKEHWWNICPSSTHNQTYFTLDTNGLLPRRVIDTALEIMGI